MSAAKYPPYAVLCSLRQLPDLLDTRYYRWRSPPARLFLRARRRDIKDIVQRQHVGVLLVHVEQIDRVASLVPVEDALLGDDHAQPIGRAIHHAGAHAAASALAAGNNGIDAEKVQMADQRRAPESAGRSFLQNRLFGEWASPDRQCRSGGGNDPSLLRHGRALLAVATERPRLDRHAVQTGDVNHGNTDLARLGDQFLNEGQRIPAGEAATARPGLDRFRHRLRLIAEYQR